MEQNMGKEKHQFKSEFWQKIEDFIGEKLPPCVVRILDEVGFNTSVSVRAMQPTDIDLIEECVNKELHHIVDDLSCCNSKTYQNQETFRFLPGHRKLILNLKNYLQEMQVAVSSTSSQQYGQLDTSNVFSFILKTLIETAQQNANKVATQFRYSENIRWFAVHTKQCVTIINYLSLCDRSGLIICEFHLTQ